MTTLAAIAASLTLSFGAYQFVGQAAAGQPAPAASAAATTTVAQVSASEPLLTTQAILPKMILGNVDAPVTMTEFSSLTCGHCGNFHRNTLPKIKKNYIDTGKVRLVLRDFPLDRLALAAAAVAHCAGPKRYFGFIDAMYATQATWATSSNPLKALEQVARMGGMSAGEFNKCLDNTALLTAIRDRAERDGKAFGIDSTPTFRIGDTQLVGNEPYEAFVQAFDAALKTAK